MMKENQEYNVFDIHESDQVAFNFNKIILASEFFNNGAIYGILADNRMVFAYSIVELWQALRELSGFGYKCTPMTKQEMIDSIFNLN